MTKLSEPDLIVNADGSVYHLCMKPEDLSENIIVVGDPNRVGEISSRFEHVEHHACNREFISATGYYKDKRITALSTGIGTDNIDIVMHELDALVNFNLETRQQHPVRKSVNIIRIGTSGSIQPDIPANTYGLATHAVGLDNLLYFYQGMERVIDQQMTRSFLQQTDWHPALSKPYFVEGSRKLIGKFLGAAIPGITVTAPGFYGPQGRRLNLDLTDPAMLRKLQEFSYEGRRIMNFEMETSALYGLGALMGHHMVTICAIIANRVTGIYIADHKQLIEGLIDLVLDKIACD